MHFQGQIKKMTTEIGNPIQYHLNLSGDLISINQLIGKPIQLKHIGYQCVNCDSTEKIFRMGFCKKCFFESPYASESIIRPELSKAHLGEEERDLAIEKQIQLTPHIVYIAYTGGFKVGVTREHQVPTRWIDQGATQAKPIARTNNRYEAGMIEVSLKEHFADKTHYKRMLQDDGSAELDWHPIDEKLNDCFPKDYEDFRLENQEVVKLNFPYQLTEKINSFTLEKVREYKGVLKGIKGQYLVFDEGYFINIRSHEGFVVDLII
ncbi:MAG: hypothetical protein CSA38_03085 [Flavobacteriales bacterium]|nr:MAG: hypothetical protein CSA38_03085 [Flavobacteriales bacterium]